MSEPGKEANPAEAAPAATVTPPPLPPPVRRSPLRRIGALVQFLLPLLTGAGLLAGLLSLGGFLDRRLHRQGKHILSFVDIDCPAPEGQSREEFLAETQYLAGLPDRFDGH